jgi:hypothetical protein
VKFISLDVFYKTSSGALLADDAVIVDAINWVVANRTQYNITAINLSLGAGAYSGRQGTS